MFGRSLRIVCLAGVAILFGSLAAGPVAAAPSARTITSRLSLAGSVFDHVAGEDVALVGDLHLLTTVSNGRMDWRLNAGHVAGAGATTGAPYLVAGADAGSAQVEPGLPIATVFLQPTLTLLPPGPPTHPPSPIRLLVAVSFDAKGQVSGVVVHFDNAPPNHDVAG